jgi:quercetin dioxygenase-like cupin family protein
VKLAPDRYKVILNNDKVRMLDVRLKPGQRSPMHSHPDYIIYALNGGTAQFWDEHGKTSKMTLRAGQRVWRNDESHAVQNIGKHTIHVLNIELKGIRLFQRSRVNDDLP